jgi:L,D-transpeptidase catalytic domain
MRAVTVAVIATIMMAAAISAARAEILVIVDKSAQRMTVARDGVTLYNWPVSTGRPGYSTPSGGYTAFRMEAEHYSREWDDAPMPHSIFFTKIGHAIHGTNDTQRLGTPASHGCVRLSPENAATLYAMVQQEGVTKTKVMLTGNEQIALARLGPAALRDRGNAREPPRNSPNARPDDGSGYAQRQDVPGNAWADRSQPRDDDPDYDSDVGYSRPGYDRPSYGYGPRGYDDRPYRPQYYPPQYYRPQYYPPRYAEPYPPYPRRYDLYGQ